MKSAALQAVRIAVPKSSLSGTTAALSGWMTLVGLGRNMLAFIPKPSRDG
jgi:hypothetical protein